MTQTSPQENYYDADQTVFAQHAHSILSKKITPDEKYTEDLTNGPVVYKGESEISENRAELLKLARENIGFNADVVSQMAADIKAGKKVSVASFTHFPDIAYNLIAEHLKSQDGITDDMLKDRFKVVGGFPIALKGSTANNPAHGKLEHIIKSQLDAGIEADSISVKGSRLTDDSPKNIAQAWAYGMDTTWVDDNGKLKENILPVTYKDAAGKSQILPLTINADKSIKLPNSMTEEELNALSQLTGIPSKDLDVGQTLMPPFEKDRKYLNDIIVKVKHNMQEKGHALSTPKLKNTRDSTIEAVKRAKGAASSKDVQVITEEPSPPQVNALKEFNDLFKDIIGNEITEENLANERQNLEFREKIAKFVSQYIDAGEAELEYREANPQLPGIKATSEVIDRTFAFMVHIGGETGKISDLEKQATALSKDIEKGPSATSTPKFQADYANFCAAAHDNVAAYHGIQKERFLELAKKDKSPGGADYWNQCAETATKLQEISQKDAQVNREIGKGFSQGQEQSVMAQADKLKASLEKSPTTPEAKPRVDLEESALKRQGAFRGGPSSFL